MAGLVYLRGAAPAREALDKMSDAGSARGRDGEGHFLEGGVAFAHRLRKVAPTPSRQPLVSAEAVLLFDGWIYDHAALAEAAGVQTPATDTEAVLEAYRAFGEDFVSYLDGDFAVALWDRKQRALFLARDRMGTRPLFWAREGERVAFASSVPAVLRAPWVSQEFARERLAEYLSFGTVHAPRTLLRAVNQVEPGAVLRLDVDATRGRTFATFNYAPPGTPAPRESEVVERLEAAVQQAVRRRVPRGGIRTGLYLSGGLGSSVIASASRRLFLDLPTFSIGFTDDPYPELPFAGRVARLMGLEHHQLSVGTAELAALVPDTVAALGHPVGHPASLLQLALARAASERVSVVLSGDGSEELLGGRMLDGLNRSVRLARIFAAMPAPAREVAARLLHSVGRGKRITTPPERWALEMGLGGNHIFDDDARRALLRDPELVRPGVRREVLQPFYAGLHTDPVNTILHGWLRSGLMEDALVRADRTAAAGGVDHRFPLLDAEIVSAAAALPGSLKLRRPGDKLHSRWALRALLNGTLPPPLLQRPKRSLPTPLGAWLAGPGRLFLEARVQRLLDDPRRLWRPDAIRHLVRDIDHTPGAGARLWTLVFLDLWLDGAH